MYNLKIVRRFDGGSEVIEVKAEGQTGGGITLLYEFDGCRYVLRADGDTLEQRRLGDINLVTVFSENKESYCALDGPSGSGEFAITTHLLKIDFHAQGFAAECEYDMGDGRICRLEMRADKII